MSLFIKNIKSLVQVSDASNEFVSGKEMKILPTIQDAFLFMKGDKIESFGKMSEIPQNQMESADEMIDAEGKLVFPSWCDSHTHIVYAGTREKEFVNRINGLSYEEIAKRGGGILNSAKMLSSASEDELFESAMQRLNEVILQGTGAIEIKSGYGLTFESEMKMLRVIRAIKEKSPIPVKSTFLGAHAIPKDKSKLDYMNLLLNELFPAIAQEGLADYCDVFCERGYFDVDDTRAILKAGEKYGIKGKVHAEQLSHSGGVAAAIECNARSVDHLEFLNSTDIELLKKSQTMPVILPGAQFFLGLQHPPARAILDAGLPLAISSDYNPGSSPSGNMALMIALSCIQYKMTPEEAIHAATINSAYAMDLSASHGSICIGKKANVFITKKISSYSFLPYAFGSQLIDTVILNGKVHKHA